MSTVLALVSGANLLVTLGLSRAWFVAGQRRGIRVAEARQAQQFGKAVCDCGHLRVYHGGGEQGGKCRVALRLPGWFSDGQRCPCQSYNHTDLFKEA